VDVAVGSHHLAAIFEGAAGEGGGCWIRSQSLSEIAVKRHLE
jgi:hypothetical protein